jgi:putative intracellular protease/amidase
MLRHRVLTFLVIVLIFLASCSPGKSSDPKVLFILQEKSADMDFMLKDEVGVMATMLEQAGYKVVYASASGESLGSGDTSITPDLKLSDVKVKDYVGFVLPCMAHGADRLDDPDTDKILTEAQAAGKPIAAASGAIHTLQQAGILDGKKFGTNQVELPDIHTGTYMGTVVVQDGNLMTSAFCPFAEKIGLGTNQTSELLQKFIEALKSST